MPTSEHPFVIEHRHILESPGHFVPQARLIVTSALRTSGVLASLTDQEARTLLALLTFLSPNGEVQATVPQMAEALGTSDTEAQRRLHELTQITWQEQPLVYCVERETALPVYCLSPHLVTNEQPPALPEPAAPVVHAAGRAAIIAHSRARYGRPRAEAEALVAEQLGQSPEASADTPIGEAWRRLLALGVSREQVEELIAGYPVQAILQQLEWLPERGARNPARLVVAAIRENYEPPLSVRQAEEANEEPVYEETEQLGECPDAELPTLEVPEEVAGGADV